MTSQSTAPQPKSDDEPQESNESQESIAIPESKEELKKLLLAVSQEFAGPIPPPSMMKQYEETLPGSADRILKMAETQSEHRQWMEKKILSFSNREVHIGQMLGFFNWYYRYNYRGIHSPKWCSDSWWIHWYSRSCRSCSRICYWK